MDDPSVKNRRTLGITVLIIALVLFVPMGLLEARQGKDMGNWGVGILSDFVLSLVAVAFTLIAIDPILLKFQRHADEKQAKERQEAELSQLKSELIGKLQSRIEGVAAVASEELSRRWWLRDGSLEDIFLEGANLNRVSLMGAKLKGSFFDGALMEKADLRDADLEDASLEEVSLRGSDLSGANLKNATLEEANLEGACLDGADFRGAYLEGANFKDAHWKGAKVGWSLNCEDHITLPVARFDETTCLPDGTMWTPTTDFNRFTDPNHPEFWTLKVSRRVYIAEQLEAFDRLFDQGSAK